MFEANKPCVCMYITTIITSKRKKERIMMFPPGICWRILRASQIFFFIMRPTLPYI